MTTKRPALGKGLSALIGGEKKKTEPGAEATMPASEPAGRRVMELPLDRIVPNRFQARKIFRPESMDELAASLKQSGILQPLSVRPLPNQPGKYELIAGERRFRAAGRAGLKTVPCVVMEANDLDLSTLSLVENLQREDLNPLDEAEGLKTLVDHFHLTQQDAADRIGKNRSTIANLLRLLSLPETVKDGLAAGSISEGHGRALLALGNADEMAVAYREVVAREMTVRETEHYVARLLKSGGKTKRVTPPQPDPNTDAYLRELSVRYGTKVRLAGSAKKGKVEIHYFSKEDRDRILELLGK
jgi:ParB family transcriptional regulator, chromosome partitioning protein